jgi:hypothetical protein
VPGPKWTDFNSSDPGVTLLQLFAFLAFALLFGLALKRWLTSRSGSRGTHGAADPPPPDAGEARRSPHHFAWVATSNVRRWCTVGYWWSLEGGVRVGAARVTQPIQPRHNAEGCGEGGGTPASRVRGSESLSEAADRLDPKDVPPLFDVAGHLRRIGSSSAAK